MSWIKELLEYVFGGLRFWYIIEPWEQGIRTRFGKYQKLMRPGIHFRLPVFDGVYVQNTNIRIKVLPIQTISLQCGKTVSASINLTWKITDIQKLHNTLHRPESTLGDMVKNKIALHLHQSRAVNLNLYAIEEKTKKEVATHQYGIEILEVRFTNYAVVDTFRLIQDQDWNFENPFFERK